MYMASHHRCDVDNRHTEKGLETGKILTSFPVESIVRSRDMAVQSYKAAAKREELIMQHGKWTGSRSNCLPNPARRVYAGNSQLSAMTKKLFG